LKPHGISLNLGSSNSQTQVFGIEWQGECRQRVTLSTPCLHLVLVSNFLLRALMAVTIK